MIAVWPLLSTRMSVIIAMVLKLDYAKKEVYVYILRSGVKVASVYLGSVCWCLGGLAYSEHYMVTTLLYTCVKDKSEIDTKTENKCV